MQHSKKSLERQREESRKAQEEHTLREERFKAQTEAKAGRKKVIIAAAAIVVLLIAAGGAYAMLAPGKFDSFAQCLTAKGAVMQGENWCQYTQAQKGMFGNSFKYINYEVNPILRLRPTWIIDGNKYETVQSFEHLSALTGCEIFKEE